MFDVCLSVTQHADELMERLGYEFGSLTDYGLAVTMSEDRQGDFTFIDCLVKEENSVGGPEVLRHSVASAISDLIVTRIQDDLLRKIMLKNYDYLSDDEKLLVLEGADKMLHCDPESGAEDCSKSMSRRDAVMKRVIESLKADNKLVIDGFIRFRLKDYVEELSDAIDKSVDSYLMDKEYNEFVRLLKYFVDIQEPRIPEVNIVFREDGLYRLLDDNGNNVSSDYLESPTLLDSDVDYDDLLISALIAISPVEVKIHLTPSLPVVKTIMNVFEGRAFFCSGKNCGYCTKHLTIKGPTTPARE